MSTLEGRASFRDAPCNCHDVGPANPIRTLMGVYPIGGSYSLETVGNEVHVYRTPDRTQDAGPITAAEMQAQNREFWGKRGA